MEESSLARPRLAGKLALVTGAGRGLGRVIARRLAAEGASLVVVARTERDLVSLLDEAGAPGARHTAVPLDLMEPAAVDRLAEQLERIGCPDTVVHALGGTLDLRDPWSEGAEWERVWRYNLGVAIDVNLRMLPLMRARGSGRIVHVSSTAAVKDNAALPYNSAKAALNAYVRGMARVVAPEGIVMSAVMPGPLLVEGGHWERVARESPTYFDEVVASRLPLKRFGQAEEVAGVIAFLCSAEASLCVGSIWGVDGGER